MRDWPPITDESVTARIRDAVAASGWTQKDLAAFIEMDETALSKALNGKRRFTTVEMALLAEAISVDVSYLLAGQWVRPAYMYPAVTESVTSDLTTCDQCGGAVVDSQTARDIHDEWHRKWIEAQQ